MSLQHIQKNSPGLLPKPAKFEKNPPNGYRVIRKTKCGAGGAGGAGGAAGAGGAGGARSSPIHKQASLAGRLIIHLIDLDECGYSTLSTRPTHPRTDANLYPPERQLTIASEPSFDLEGEANGQI